MTGLKGNKALRVTVAPLLSVTLERSCPPPGILDCGPALRIVGRLPGRTPKELSRGLAAIVPVALRTAGYRGMRVAQTPAGEADGRVVAEQETLARWRVEGDAFELVTSGLKLGDRRTAARLSAGGGPASEGLRVEVNEAALTALLDPP